jgi:hypothetical protein
MDLQKLRRKREARNDTSADVKLRQEVTPFSVFLYQHVVCGAEDARMSPPSTRGEVFFLSSKNLSITPIQVATRSKARPANRFVNDKLSTTNNPIHNLAWKKKERQYKPGRAFRSESGRVVVKRTHRYVSISISAACGSEVKIRVGLLSHRARPRFQTSHR